MGHLPFSIDARPNSLKFSESPHRTGVMHNCGSGSQTRERKPSKAWAAKMAALNRPITAVTVSIITNILPPLHARENDTDPYTVKKIPGPNRRSSRGDDLM